MRFEQHMRSFLRALTAFKQDTPLAKFLPEYFRQNKQMGSNDRRNVAKLLYTYFRLGNALKNNSPEERVLIAEFLCTNVDSPFLKHFRPDLHEHIDWPLAQKITFLVESFDFKLVEIFPFGPNLSEEIDRDAFLKSLFIQPNLFIRANSGQIDWLERALHQAQIPFEQTDIKCFALANGTALEKAIGTVGYHVQDLSSQRTANYFKPLAGEFWWDACAASGGKSLLLNQMEPKIKLLVSDIRESVLRNLDERFKSAGITNYRKEIVDLTQPHKLPYPKESFDGIILDAPCSGSGTWGRTPELISQFKTSSIEHFQALQRKIAAQVIPYLKPGKPLIYITCSAFSQENEEVVEFLVKEHSLHLDSMEVLKGYQHKADTMFVAKLIRVAY